jgi:hypothetical protein
MTRDGSGDRGLIARNAGDQCRPRHPLGIELARPSIGESERAARCFPAELVAQSHRQLPVDIFFHRLLERSGRRRRRCAILPLPRERDEELGRKEMAVRVVDDHGMQDSECRMQRIAF